MSAPSSNRAIYAISVAAELTGAGIQNLRVYERHGLVEPARTEGGTRRYSEADLERVRRILVLLEDGLNLAGISVVLMLEDDNSRLRRLIRDRDRGSVNPAPARLPTTPSHVSTRIQG